jgi:hypothetical protein
MRVPYSSNGKPFLPLSLIVDTQTLSREGLVDSGSDVNVLPLKDGQALGASWDPRKTLLRLGGTLSGVSAMPLLLMVKIGDFPAVRLAFAWCETDEVPLVLGQTNFFMEFDVCFFRSRGEFSVKPKSLEGS